MYGPYFVADSYHGRSGPFGVQYAVHHHPVDDIFVDAAKELGFDLGDVNAANENKGFDR
jgi:hypothetical protein